MEEIKTTGNLNKIADKWDKNNWCLKVKVPNRLHFLRDLLERFKIYLSLSVEVKILLHAIVAKENLLLVSIINLNIHV